MSSELVVGEQLPDQSRVDAVIWKYVGLRSTREIAEIAGVSPADVLRRTGELLDEVDVLTIQQRRARLLIELEGMARDARERAAGASDEYASGLLNSATSAIKTLLVELARMEKGSEDAVSELNALRVREMLRVVEVSTLRALQDIASRYGLDASELTEVFEGYLVEAAGEVEGESS